MQLIIRKNAFSLMELMITVVLIGFTAAFAIPSYTKAIQKSNERDAITQLKILHAANLLYQAQTGGYFSTSTATLSDINSALGLNIIANGFAYAYVFDATGTYTVTTSWPNGAAFTIMVKSTELNESGAGPQNPCCAAGTCLVAGTCI